MERIAKGFMWIVFVLGAIFWVGLAPGLLIVTWIEVEGFILLKVLASVVWIMPIAWYFGEE